MKIGVLRENDIAEYFNKYKVEKEVVKNLSQDLLIPLHVVQDRVELYKKRIENK